MFSINNTNNPNWQLCEDYLSPLGRTYQITKKGEKELHLLEDPVSQTTWKTTALKISSYCTVVLPLLALAGRTYYRSCLTIQKRNLTNKQRLIKQYQAKLSRQDQVEKSPLERAIAGQAPPVDLEKLNLYLADYENYRPELIALTYQAFIDLTRDDSAENLQKAKKIHTALCQFYRTHHFERADHNFYLRADSQNLGHVVIGVGDYTTKSYELHMILFELRRQIKIRTKLKETDPKIKELLKLSFLHGSQSHVIEQAIRSTDGQLVPTGQLAQTPFSGEMTEGALGVNRHSLSGTPLVAGSISLSYARQFQFNIDREQHKYNEFLKCEHRVRYLFRCGGGLMMSHATTIQRLAAWDPRLIDRAQLKTTLDKLEKEADQLLYDEYLNPFSYVWGLFSSRTLKYDQYVTLVALEKIRAVADGVHPTLSEEQKKEILQSQGVIFASNRVKGVTINMQFNNEDLYPGALKIGTEITHLIVKDTAKAEALLEKHNLKGRVTVVSMDEFEQAIKLEKKLAPYFVDILKKRTDVVKS